MNITIEDCLEDIEDMLIEDIKEEKKYDSQIKVPTKSQQKKITKLALEFSSEPDICEYEKAWEIVKQQSIDDAFKRSVNKAKREGLVIPTLPSKDPFPKRTNRWRNFFLKKRDEEGDKEYYETTNKTYGSLYPYYKTPSNQQVLDTLNSLDIEQVGWDNNFGTASDPNIDVINIFIAKFDQLHTELRKEKKSSKKVSNASSSGCLVLLLPFIAGAVGVISFFLWSA